MSGPLQLLGIALAGAVGTLARYGLTHLVQRHAGLAFPWGTFVVNVAGCLAFGICWSLIEQRAAAVAAWRAVILVGLLGGFTTFSSFSMEFWTLFERGQMAQAAAYVGASVIIGIAACGVGMATIRQLPA